MEFNMLGNLPLIIVENIGFQGLLAHFDPHYLLNSTNVDRGACRCLPTT